jgi:hypothetical protein
MYELLKISLLITVVFTTNVFSQERHVVQGSAAISRFPLFECQRVVDNYRGAAIGHTVTTAGHLLRIPLIETAIETGLGPVSHDLYNECDGLTPQDSSTLNIDTVPIIEIDPEGEVVTGYIVADNYFELYIDGRVISVDSTPFTPFNSSVFRFKASKPYTITVLVIDWDEHLGLGMELFPQGPGSERLSSGNAWHTGDAGLLLRLSDGTVTDASWRVQTFSIAPLDDPGEVVERGSVHDTSHRGRSNSNFVKPDCATQSMQPQGEDRLYPQLSLINSNCYAVHYPVPDNWRDASMNDTIWPSAEIYTNDEVGTRNLPAFNRFPNLFQNAQWIWSSNLVLDNLVIARKTVN